MNLITASKILAQLSWTRLIRGKSLYITGVIALVPVLLAFVHDENDKAAAWRDAAGVLFRFVIPIGAAIHVSGAIGDELEQRTFTFLWSRPIPRSSIVIGRVLVMAPLLFAISAVVLVLIYIFANAGSEVKPSDLAQAIVGAGASSLAFSLFAVGGGSIFPRQSLLVTLGTFLTFEQLLSVIPIVKYISIVAHSRSLAGLDRGGWDEIPTGGAIAGLLLLGGAWLTLAILRVNSAEYAAAKEI